MRIAFIFLWILSTSECLGQKKDFKVLAYVRHERTDFIKEATVFFNDLADRNNFTFDIAGGPLSDSLLVNYQVVMFLGEGPYNKPERKAFERYMDNGGGWIGFHQAWQYEKGDSWPWFHEFIGTRGYTSCKPALPARLLIEDNTHPATRNLPQYITAPADEWIQWISSPRENKNIKVLASLSPTNYPLGMQSILKGGDTPVVWTNTKYNMIYLGMGYDRQSLSDRLQNQLFKDALTWVAKRPVGKREAFAANGELPEMIKLQGGKFMMGDDAGDKDEKPAREVSVPDFSMAKTETTRGQWRNFCLSTGRKMPEDPWFKQSEQHPVVNVSWDHAMAYCIWLSDVTGKHYRLPTEAEWEFAARGGLKSKGFPYSGGKNADSVAWFGRKTDGPMAVAQKVPNELGLYDLTGNVWEWTSDWYDADKQFYTFRGGAWDIGIRNNRIAYRNPLAPMSRNHNKGFRVVCD